MGQVLHGCARTTEAVRSAIQHSQASLRDLARRHGVNPKTIAKWRARGDVTDRRTGPGEPRSTTLLAEEEAVVVAFRRHTLPPLDDCLYALQPTLSQLTRSALHCCLQRHGISRLPETDGEKPAHKRFKAYPIGYFHIDIAEMRTEQGKLHLFVAIDRTSKFAFAQLHERATTRIAAEFLRARLQAVPYRVHTVLTGNGQHFTTPGNIASAAPLIRKAMDSGEIFRAHSFELACAQNRIEHRLTMPYHPWTNGQVERMNRTLREAAVQRYQYGSHDELRGHLALFLDAYNYARRLKTLKGLTPYEFICRSWAAKPHRFTANPHHEMPPNT
jgi:transposase-like protein